jgi:hypothetical protein
MRLNEIKKIGRTPPAILGQAAMIIQQHCQPFLSQIGDDIFTYKLWRGVRKAPDRSISVVPCPVNRSPKDTAREIHQAADRYFLKKFGIKFRSNSFFVTGSEEMAASYGTEVWNPGAEVIVIPQGDFKFCWSPITNDFYQSTEEAIDWPNDLDDDATVFEINAYFDKEVFALCERMKYQTTDLKRAIKSRHEIMLHCNSAYYLYTLDYDMAEIGEMIRHGTL